MPGTHHLLLLLLYHIDNTAKAEAQWLEKCSCSMTRMSGVGLFQRAVGGQRAAGGPPLWPALLPLGVVDIRRSEMITNTRARTDFLTIECDSMASRVSFQLHNSEI